jgi:hypothetical protein
MLTVVTQNSRLLRRSEFSGDRMAIGFGYPHRSVPDARRQHRADRSGQQSKLSALGKQGSS